MEPPKPPPPSVPSQVPSMPPEKKRKRTSSASRKPSKAPAPPSSSASAIKATLIIDNGGHTLKYGWSTDSSPKHMPNITAKLLHQWTVLVGDEMNKVQPNQVETTTRSTERGIITNFATQIQVWKRVLDDLGIVVPVTSEASQVFGWNVAASKSKTSTETASILPQSSAVLLLVPPHCPRTVLETCASIWCHEFQFGRVGFAVSPVMAANNNSSSALCMVDIGWSATHIVPVYQHKPLSKSIRRMPLGGRHLLQLYKYHVSYRQWNLMDQEFLLEEIQHQVAFLSFDFEQDLRQARRIPLGKRPFDLEFVLPDYSTTYKGFVRLPAALKQQQQQQEAEAAAVVVKEEQEESAMNEGEEAENEEKANKDENDDEEEEESDDTKRRRILRQRQEEERRRQELEAERQVLMISVERFTIPEVLFRPTDAGLAATLCGLPQAIVASISSCPREYQAIMYQSIRIVGGLAQLTNLQERLQRELQSLAPCQYEVRVQVADSPVEQAWLGAKKWVEQTPYDEWSMRMDEWEASRKGAKKVKAWHRLLAENGGIVV